MIKIFSNHFKDLCNNLTIKKRKFILGLSGGIDSMALLQEKLEFLNFY